MHQPMIVAMVTVVLALVSAPGGPGVGQVSADNCKAYGNDGPDCESRYMTALFPVISGGGSRRRRQADGVAAGNGAAGSGSVSGGGTRSPASACCTLTVFMCGQIALTQQCMASDTAKVTKHNKTLDVIVNECKTNKIEANDQFCATQDTTTDSLCKAFMAEKSCIAAPAGGAAAREGDTKPGEPVGESTTAPKKNAVPGPVAALSRTGLAATLVTLGLGIALVT